MNAFRNIFRKFGRRSVALAHDANFFGKKRFNIGPIVFVSTMIIATNEKMLKSKLYSAENPPQENKPEQKAEDIASLTREQKLASLRKLNKYEVCSSDMLREGDIMEVEIGDDHKHKIIVIRSDNALYALGAVCAYDGKTPLKDGLVFGDKLYCPIHGCAYCIRTGRAEYAPAIDSLPRFHIEEKEGKVLVFAPKIAPIRVIAPSGFRDYNDLRKIIVIGAGPAGFACVETLRQFGYTGEITMISKDTKLPYDKTKLTKTFKDIDYEDLLLRDREWYKDNGVTYLLGREVVHVDNKHGGPFVVLEDGLKLEYDGLLIAVGTTPEVRVIRGSENKENIHFLRNIQDHKKLREDLARINNLTVMGLNLKSLEIVSTIRQEYPNVKITVVDENEKSYIDNLLGPDVSQALINLHLDNGVSFIQDSHVNLFEGDETRVKKLCFSTGFEIDTDAVIFMPNNSLANTEFIADNEHLDQFDYDEMARVRTDYNQRGGYKRIFVAGGASSGLYHPNNDRMASDNWNVSYHQGVTSAYNIMALDIPFYQIPFNYSLHYGKVFQYSGYCNFYDEMYIEGDVKNFDFIAMYSWNGEIVAACGTPNQQKKMLIINEGLRLNMLPPLSDIVERKKTFEGIYNDIMKSNRSGCFKDLIDNMKYEPNREEVIWIRRDRINEHYNFWEKGMEPTTPKTVYK